MKDCGCAVGVRMQQCCRHRDSSGMWQQLRRIGAPGDLQLLASTTKRKIFKNISENSQQPFPESAWCFSDGICAVMKITNEVSGLDSVTFCAVKNQIFVIIKFYYVLLNKTRYRTRALWICRHYNRESNGG
jgi:hypothetical protein